MGSEGAVSNIESDSHYWQNSCYGLKARLHEVCVRQLWTDCEVIVGVARKRIPAHRVILAAASPVLAAILDSPLATPGLIDLSQDMESDIFEIVFLYIYTDNIIFTSSKQAVEVYKAAHYLMIPQVLSVCKSYLLYNITPQNVFSLCEFSKAFDEKELYKECLCEMSNNTREILTAIEGVSVTWIERIFSMPGLAIESELELFQAAERWVQNYSALGLPENPRDLIQGALRQIRFLTICPIKFAEYEMSDLLSDSQKLAILSNILSAQSQLKMPEGYSTNRNHRNLLPNILKIKGNLRKLGMFEKERTSVTFFNLNWSLEVVRSHFNSELLSVNIICDSYSMNKITNTHSLYWSCEAKIKFRVVSHSDEVSDLEATMDHLFTRTSYCCSWIVHWNLILNRTDAYTKNGFVIVETILDLKLPLPEFADDLHQQRDALLQTATTINLCDD